MATTIVITCPECDKQIKAPAELEGKKIRCKGCGHTFVVRSDPPPAEKARPAPKPAKKKAPAPPAKPKARPAAPVDDDNPYIMTEESLTPRCPHCAAELEGDDAVICLSCGYNTQTRTRVAPVATYEHTFLDWTLWLGPAILCVLTFFGMIGAIIFILTSLAPIIEDNKDAWWAFAPRAMQLWGTIICVAIMFFTARFAIKRLIFNARPPEKIKGKL